MPKLVHFEIPVDDAQRAGALYRDVLGWEASRFGGEPYWLVRAGAEVPSSSPAPASSRSSWRCCLRRPGRGWPHRGHPRLTGRQIAVPGGDVTGYARRRCRKSRSALIVQDLIL